ncbi:hypothetical protein KSP40_PGU009519 [Platanthera guangdongensis]|uniref:Uncharacterized protein n=1 Tax=Platanthera guangdongensis TaxID=2320717 RepID=A0ABR2LNM4_9ASPA
MEELQTRGFSVVKAPGNTPSPAVGEWQGVASIPKTSPIIDIKGSVAPSDGGGFYDLFAISGNSVDALGKATWTLDTETTLRLAGLEEELKQDEEVDNQPKHPEEMSAKRKWALHAVPAARLAKEAAAKAE